MAPLLALHARHRTLRRAPDRARPSDSHRYKRRGIGASRDSRKPPRACSGRPGTIARHGSWSDRHARYEVAGRWVGVDAARVDQRPADAGPALDGVNHGHVAWVRHPFEPEAAADP